MTPLARALTGAAALALLAGAAPAPKPECANGYCTMRMTAPQLLRAAEQLVLAHRFDEARPLIAALAHAPELTMERHFLQGYVAVETGDLDTAAKSFRAVLALRPELTRARLELARTLLMQGKDKAADYHFRLAQEDESLPPEVLRTIYASRGLIRDRKTWDLSINFGIAPDSNINSATSDRTVDVIFGNATLPLTLNDDARARTGIGQTANVSGSVRLRLLDGLAVNFDADGNVVNYDGKAADDISTLLAAGPELTLKDGARIGVAATVSQRWYGGRVAQESVGARLSAQKDLSAGSRIGAQLDVRRIESGFGSAYDGEQIGGFLTYEQVVNRSIVASVTGFVRRESLKSQVVSNREYGVIAGLGGELPWGINAGVSAQVSRARYDAAQALFSREPRQDWRLQGRLYLGARKIRVQGFSPSVSYTYSSTLSNLGLYDFERHRVEFQLARYF